MKKVIIGFMFMIGALTAYCQQSENSVKFDTIIKHVNELYEIFPFLQDSIKLPVIFKEKDYQIEISDNPIPFDRTEIVLKNPYGDLFPISFSVIYQNRIISLFEPGQFVCHIIPSMDRDLELEKSLNIKQFQYHWLIGDELAGYSEGKYYYLNSHNKWMSYKNSIPIKDQPKLFEDETYISFCDCLGEWGGTVYFYHKASQKVYFTEATCANTIRKEGDKYLVLSHLGHFMGSTKLIEIDNPEVLSQIKLENITKPCCEQAALGYSDKSGAAKVVFNYFGVQFFSSFTYQNRVIYLINWREETFFAEIENNTIKIINPLFNRKIYSHNPVTTLYDNQIIINLDYYNRYEHEYRERSCILINNNQLIKLDWNKTF
jgi:hypothetical protein